MRFLDLLVIAFTFVINNSMAFQMELLKGKVMDRQTKRAVEFCAVAVVGTSIGTVTNSKGEFELGQLPNHEFQLILSHVGYKNKIIRINPENSLNELSIVLVPKVFELDEVSVSAKGRGKLARQRRREMSSFLTMVLGYNYDERLIELVNTEDIDIDDLTSKTFNFSDKYDLTFINQYLGYEIQYYDFSFVMNSINRTYLGYPVFKELESNDPQQIKTWKKNRESAYKGSLRHFLFSLINDRLTEEGFLVNVTNFDPSSVISKDRKHDRTTEPLKIGETLTKHNLVLIPDEEDIYIMKLKGTLELFFMENSDESTTLSYITMEKDKTQIYPNGVLKNPLSLVLYGHLSTLGVYEMLPFNYLPEKN